MAAAARLRVKGHDVRILEQSDTAGGKAKAFSRDGFVFDTGPSLLTIPAVYRDLFLKTGASLEDSLDLRPVDPGTKYHWSDGTKVQLPGVGTAASAEALAAVVGTQAGTQWRALMTRAAKMWQLTRKPILESPVSGPRDLFKLISSIDDVRTIAPGTSLRKLGKQTFDDPRMVMLLDRFATYTGSDPRKAPAALATVPYVEQVFGSWHIGGGISNLSGALYQRCLERGVTVDFNADVTQVVTDAGRVSAVRLADGQTLTCDIVVANSDATHLYADLLTRSVSRGPLKQLRKSTASFSGFVLMLAVQGRTPGISHHNLWFPADYDAEFDSVFTGREVADPAIYACVPDDPAMRPDDDHESWFILVNAPRHGNDKGARDWSSPEFANTYADQILERLAHRGTDLRERVLWRELRTPADLERLTRAPGGAIYGTSSNGARAAFLRPANQSPLPGLYLVGGSSHPGGGLPLVGMSAEIVSNLIGRAPRS